MNQKKALVVNLFHVVELALAGAGILIGCLELLGIR
jgi:hypothetical protein